MKTANIYIINLSIIIIFGLLSCEKGMQDNYVAMVGDVPITEYEFTMRYNFNPYLSQIHSVKEAKKLILSTLIAEKLLALESLNSSDISSDISTKIDQHKKEVMIEQFRRDSVENQIAITDNDLKNEYIKAMKEIDIQYVAFRTLEEASILKNEIDNGATYENAIRNYMDKKGWQNEMIPEKTVKWNTESYDVEEKIFALNPGEVSKPMNINGDYYIIKTKEIRTTHNPSKNDFTDRLPALKDRILKNKIEKKYRDFFNQNIAEKLGFVDWKKLNNVFELITNDVDFNQNSTHAYPFSDEKALSNEVYLSYENQQSQLKNIPVVNFPDGSEWQMGKLMTILKNGTFAFNYKNKIAFKKSFEQNVLLSLEYEAIYQLAKEAGYDNNERVLVDTKIWETYYRANDYRFQKLKQAVNDIYMSDSTQYISSGQLTPRQQFRLEFFDNYLSKLAEKYTVTINHAEFDHIQLNKTNMVVMKKHFAHRQVVPLTEPLSGLSQWGKTVERILKKSETI